MSYDDFRRYSQECHHKEQLHRSLSSALAADLSRHVYTAYPSLHGVKFSPGEGAPRHSGLPHPGPSRFSGGSGEQARGHAGSTLSCKSEELTVKLTLTLSTLRWLCLPSGLSPPFSHLCRRCCSTVRLWTRIRLAGSLLAERGMRLHHTSRRPGVPLPQGHPVGPVPVLQSLAERQLEREHQAIHYSARVSLAQQQRVPSISGTTQHMLHSIFLACSRFTWVHYSCRTCIEPFSFSPDVTKIVLLFMYGAIIDLPEGASASEVLLAADMLGVDSLKDVVELVLTRDYCHFFPKPLGEVKRTIPECLSISQTFGLRNLHMRCKRWVAEHFVKVWSERSFAFLPVELQQTCFRAVTESLTVQNAVTVLCHSEQLICSLPGVKWAQRVMELATALQEECLQFVVHNFRQVIRTPPFQDFRIREELTTEPLLLRKLCSAVAEGVTVDNCCDLFAAVDFLEETIDQEQQEPTGNEPFRREICGLRGRLWTFLAQSLYAIRSTTGWKTLSPRHKEKVLAEAIDEGDGRKLHKKPVLTSSKLSLAACPSAASDALPLRRNPRLALTTSSSSRGATSAMKSNGLKMANKPGDGPAPKSKPPKKPGEKAAAPKTAPAGVPVVNGTGAARARRDVAGTNGPRGFHVAKEPEKKPNPGARPKTCPPSGTSSSQTTGTKSQRPPFRKAHNGAGATQPLPGTSLKSRSPSPDGGAGDAHNLTGARPKQGKPSVKPLAAKPAPRPDGKVARGTNKSVTPSGGVAGRSDLKTRTSTDIHVLKSTSLVKKPTVARKNGKDSADKTDSETLKKTIKSTAAKPGSKLKSNTELSTDKASSKAKASTASKKTDSCKGVENDSDCRSGTSADAPNETSIPEPADLPAADTEHLVSRTGTDPEKPESAPEHPGAQAEGSGHAEPETTPHPVASSDPRAVSAQVEASRDAEGGKAKQPQSAVVHSHVGAGQARKISSPSSPRCADGPVETPGGTEGVDTPWRTRGAASSSRSAPSPRPAARTPPPRTTSSRARRTTTPGAPRTTTAPTTAASPSAAPCAALTSWAAAAATPAPRKS
uniref:BTBD8 BACK domain-containing protein n=1 Tax=Salarias fasciatus TaxID=181472 RepID=A0A672IS62_SALFA